MEVGRKVMQLSTWEIREPAEGHWQWGWGRPGGTDWAKMQRSSGWCSACVLGHFSHVRLFATPWMVASQVRLSVDSPGTNTWVGCHFFLQGLYNPGIEPASLTSPPLACGFFTTSITWEARLVQSGGGNTLEDRAVPGGSRISGLGRSHDVGRDLGEEQIWKKDDKLSLEWMSLRAWGMSKWKCQVGHRVGVVLGIEG